MGLLDPIRAARQAHEALRSSLPSRTNLAALSNREGGAGRPVEGSGPAGDGGIARLERGLDISPPSPPTTPPRPCG
jgi:hypothetical protein